MNNEKLWKDRVLPAIRELYKRSEPIIEEARGIEWEDIIKRAVENNRGQKQVPFSAFYISLEETDEIVTKAVKGLRYNWRWPYKSQIIYDEEQIKKMEAQLKTLEQDSFEYHILEEKIQMNPIYKEQEEKWEEYQSAIEVLEQKRLSGEIDRKEFNKRRDKLCKSYNMQWRSHDAEMVKFSIMNLGPSVSEKQFGIMKDCYGAMVSKIGSVSDDSDLIHDVAKEVTEDVNLNPYMLADIYIFCCNLLKDERK